MLPDLSSASGFLFAAAKPAEQLSHSHMIAPTYHILDGAVFATTSITTVLSGLLLATANDRALELQLFLLPLIGSMIVSGGMIMLNPLPETRRIVIGRSIFALFMGVLLPQLVASLHPFLTDIAIKPALLVLVGGLISGLSYVLSKPFTAELYNRSAHIAERKAAQIEKQITGNDPEK